jgi:hypothetical protein
MSYIIIAYKAEENYYIILENGTGELIGHPANMTCGDNMDIDRQADEATGNNSDVSSGVPSDPGAQIKGYFFAQGVRPRRGRVLPEDAPDAIDTNISMRHTPVHEGVRPTDRQVSQCCITLPSHS